MDYFIGAGIGVQLTGIEKAQMNRLALFKKMGRPAKILRFTYSNRAHTDGKSHGITSADLCNMFDWYQGTTTIVSQSITPEMVCPQGAQMRAAGREGNIVAYNCFKDGHLVAQIRYDIIAKTVAFVLWSDDAGHVKQTDTYDTRGFASLRLHLTPDGKRITDEYLTPDGKVAVRCTYSDGLTQRLEKITLADGREFASMEALKADFLQALDRQSPSRFFFDRDYFQELLSETQLSGPKFLMLHNNHRNYYEIMERNKAQVLRELGVKATKKKKPADFLAMQLANMGDVSGIITATPQQQAALAEDYPDLPPVYVIPAGVSVTQPQRVDFDERDPNEMIVVARISPEKGVGDAVDVVLQLHQKFPNAHLSVYGAATGNIANESLKHLNKRILRAGAGQMITFMGFRNDLDDAYNHAGMMLVTSSTEAFPTSIQEALAHGLPVISYDVAYGPADMITDGENGCLVPTGDKDAMVDVISMLLRHPDQLHLLSNGAYRLRKKYGARAVWAQYQQLPETKK